MNRRSNVFATALVAGLAVFGCAQDPSAPDSSGWVTLFDGRDLSQWHKIGDANWRIEEGAVVADKRKGKDYGYLVSDKMYRDFELQAEFWVSHDANTGIFLRCGNPMVLHDKVCYEANVFDQRKDPTYGTGALTHLAKVAPMPKAGGQWNTYNITVKGTHIVLVLNGVKTVDLQNSAFSQGYVGLQYAEGVVKFRKVRIREL